MGEASTIYKIQKISSIALIVTAIAAFIYSLGFMTGFYQLFYDGTSEMYDFYKKMQILNNIIFDASLYLLILSLLQLPFDLLKKEMSIRGFILVAVTTAITISNALVVFGTSNYFQNMYQGFDFSSLSNYKPSVLPFTLAYIIFSIAIAILVILTVIGLLSIMKSIKARRR